MNETQTHTIRPAWYMAAAGAALLFELFGCYSYLADVTRSPEALARLPLDQRAMMQAMPQWIYGAYAIAVWVGLVGAIGLLLRRRWAVPALGVSLLAVIVQFGGIFLTPAIRQVMPSDAVVVPIAIIVICALIFGFARRAQRRGWLN